MRIMIYKRSGIKPKVSEYKKDLLSATKNIIVESHLKSI